MSEEKLTMGPMEDNKQKTVPLKEVVKPLHGKIGQLVCVVDDLAAQISTMRQQMIALETENKELKSKGKEK